MSNAKHTLHLFEKAVLDAAHNFPELVPPSTQREALQIVGADLLCSGDCGTFVFLFGRRLAVEVLAAIEHIEDYDCCIMLRKAIACGPSIHDLVGDASLSELCTAAYAVDLAAAKAGVAGLVAPCVVKVPEAVAEPDRLAKDVLAALLKTYYKHGDTLPGGVFGPAYEGFGFDSRVSAREFAEAAFILRWGFASTTVYGLGREFCGHLLANLEAIEAYELCQVLRVAVGAGVSRWDDLGHLPLDSKETNLPDCNGSYEYLSVAHS